MRKISSIEVNIKEENDLISKYNNNYLNSELGDYIYDSYVRVKKKAKININIYFDYEEEKIKNLIHNYYIHKRKDLNINKERNVSISIIMIFLGIIAVILVQFIGINLLREILTIVGWLFLWEAMYNLSFTVLESIIKIKKLTSLSNSNINIIKKKVGNIC